MHQGVWNRAQSGPQLADTPLSMIDTAGKKRFSEHFNRPGEPKIEQK